jgi:hypothetical protein
MVVPIARKWMYLWRAFDHEGKILDISARCDILIAVPATISKVPTRAHLPAVQATAAMTTKARKLARKTRAAELDMEIMRAREANGLPVISPMLGLPPEKWECEFRDYLMALGDPRVADPGWLAARIREEQRRARWFVKWLGRRTSSFPKSNPPADPSNHASNCRRLNRRQMRSGWDLADGCRDRNQDVAACRYVEDLAFVIEGTPEVHPFAGDGNDHLVQVPPSRPLAQ